LSVVIINKKKEKKERKKDKKERKKTKKKVPLRKN
jgi:hypothetical protein